MLTIEWHQWVHDEESSCQTKSIIQTWGETESKPSDDWSQHDEYTGSREIKFEKLEERKGVAWEGSW